MFERYVILTKIFMNVIQTEMPNIDRNCYYDCYYQPIITELFIRSQKINISVVHITKSTFALLRNITLNTTYCFIIKTLNKQELQQIRANHLSDIDFKDFMNL